MNDDGRELHWSTSHWGGAEPGLPALDTSLMQLVLQNVATRVAVLDRDRCYLYANHEALRFMALPADEVIGRHMSEVLDPGVYASFVPLFDRLFTGEALQMRGWVQYQRQGRRFREQVLVPYMPGGGPVQAVVVCGHDRTEQRLSEQELAQQRAALRASEALKAAIFDHALAALVSMDADGRIVEFNPSAESMFGRSRMQVLGRRATDVLVPERSRAVHDEGFVRVRAGGGDARLLGRRVQMHGRRADGSEFPMEMVLWRTEADGTNFYSASIADLSERHAAAQQIERQREALRQNEKLSAMGSLLAGVSHELNNPLAVVMGRSRLLEEKCDDNPALMQDAARIREAAERCGRIVRTFLNMARSKPPQRSPMSLNDAVRAAAEMLAYSYRSHDIDLRLLPYPALPEVSADADQICQIVLNLLVNAQQALAQVDGLREVEVSTGVDGAPNAADGEQQVWLRVADNGPGVPAAAHARIFEPFFTTKAEGLGTGMGLSISRGLAREHGGELLLEADGAGSGAVFCLTLPLGAAHDSAIAPAPPAETDVPMLARVLVVDDEAELADVMREMLETAGYEVATAESGAVALELLGTARFDAVVSDLRMPDMDGAALWREIRARHPPLARRLLFVTGDTLSPAASAFLRRSGCEGLDKPFAKADLLDKVAGLLRGR